MVELEQAPGDTLHVAGGDGWSDWEVQQEVLADTLAACRKARVFLAAVGTRTRPQSHTADRVARDEATMPACDYDPAA